MSALHGDLIEFDVASILSLLSDLRKTGELSFTGDRGSALVGFDAGSIVWAECSSAPHSSEPGDVVFELLRFERAEFDFEAMDQPARSRSREQVGPVLETATSQLGEWRDIEKVVPSSDVMITLARQLPADEVVIDRAGWDLIHGIGTGETVASLGDKMQLNELGVSRIVKAVAEEGLIELNGRNLTDPASVETVTGTGKPTEAQPAKAQPDKSQSKETQSNETQSTETQSAKSGAGDSSKSSEPANTTNTTNTTKPAAANSGSAPKAPKSSKASQAPKSSKAAKADTAVDRPRSAASDEQASVATPPVTSEKAKAKAESGAAVLGTTAAGPTDLTDVDEPIEIDAVVFDDIPELQSTPGIDLVADDRQSFDDEFPPPPAPAGGLNAGELDLGSDDLPPPPAGPDTAPMVPVTDVQLGDSADGSARSRLDQMASELGLDMDESATSEAVDLDAELRPSAGSESDLVEHQQDKGRWRPFRSRS